MKWNMSFTNTLDNKGPSIDPWGIPYLMTAHSLLLVLTFTLWNILQR